MGLEEADMDAAIDQSRLWVFTCSLIHKGAETSPFPCIHSKVVVQLHS